jgi:uncharacterized cofD-like protein
LSDTPDFARQLFLYRFPNGPMESYSVKNMLFTAAIDITGSIENAIEELSRYLKIKGTILPVTTDNTDLHAILNDGTIIHGETDIDIRKVASKSPIHQVWLDPAAKIYGKAEEAIMKADLIIFGPGDLYTSVIPNILVSGFPEAVRLSNAKKLYICNIFSKQGETNKGIAKDGRIEHYTGTDYVNALEKYLGNGQITHILLHDNGFSEDTLKKYAAEKAYPVQFNIKELQEKGLDVTVRSLATKIAPIRHDPQKLAHAVMQYI